MRANLPPSRGRRRESRLGLALLLGLAVVAEASAAFTVAGRRLLRDGAPFWVRGVCYHPVPVGLDQATGAPWGDYFTANHAALHDRDFPLLRGLGVNVLRVYGWAPGADHTAFLDRCWNGGVDPQFVLVNRWIDPNTNWSDPAAVAALAADFAALEEQLANHPAVLALLLGNETNWPHGNGATPAYWAAHDAIAAAVKAKNPARLVSVPITDAPAHLAAGDAAFPRLDFWSMQVYRGTTFGTFFADYAARSSRPLVVTEFGLDAYNHAAGAEYPDRAAFPADVLGALWRELLVHSAVVSGGCVFAFSDEWGKVAAPLAHDAGGFPFPAWPDGYMDEEWWGLFSVAKNPTGPDTLTPRATAGRLRGIFTAPAIALRAQPAAATVAPGGTATLAVEAVSPLTLSYQWRRDGVPLAGATKASLTLADLTAADAGDYDVIVTGAGAAGGTIVSEPARVLVAAPLPGCLAGLSVRGPAGMGSATLVAGVAVSGSGSVEVLARGIGPTLTGFGVGGALGDPRLEVFAGTTALTANDDWAAAPGGPAGLRAVFATVGAFDLVDASRDAALTLGIDGPRTFHVTGAGGATGVALAEIYLVNATGGARLAGVSARNRTGAGSDVLTAGFVVDGNAPVTLLIRGVGPTLASYGVTGVLADPVVKVFDAARREVLRGDNWADAPDADRIAAAAAQVGDFALPVGRDAALLRPLPAGLYTVQVASPDGTATGVALVEVYEVR